MSAIAQTLESIIGADAVCSIEQVAEPLRGAIAQAVTPGTSVRCVVYPNTQDELGAVMACAHQNGWRVLPCGRGSKLPWGGLAEGVDLVISTARLNRLVQHAVGDLTVTVEAGMPFADLQTLLNQERQFLALDPTYPESATLGGIVATGDAGSWRQRYGGVRDMLIGLSFVRYDGQKAKAGGRVVKNVAGYDLMKLMTGSYGTLGILSELTFRIYPQQEASQTVLLTGGREAIAQVASILRASVLTPTMLDWLSPAVIHQLGLGENLGLAVRFQSSPESVTDQAKRLMEMGRIAELTVQALAETDETRFWQQAQAQIWPSADQVDGTSSVICKIGGLPVAAASLLQEIHELANIQGVACYGRIHVSSGVGVLRFDTSNVAADWLEKVRSRCETEQGYLTILEAPVDLKQKMEVWGYSGNALALMRRIKQQFDPGQNLSPHRFVGGI